MKMNKHLSKNQFARCFVATATTAEQEHLARCAECKAELDRVHRMVSSFRTDVRNRVEARAGQGMVGVTVSRRPLRVGFFASRWAFIAASVVVFAMVPFLAHEEKPQIIIQQPSTVTDPNALMDAVNRHLSRTLPAPMEPMMALLPSEETNTESGGVQ